MNITEKLLKARKLIKETSIQKEGTNTFSKYDYFTPSQVSELVNNVCQELKILPVFSLCKDKFGLYGSLKLVDLEAPNTENTIVTQMRTEMPVITATNMTQQMGGCETYTKRYMLMSAFDITDNNLDFDSQDNRPKAPIQPAGKPVEPPKNESKPQSIGEDISLNISAANSMKELNELWGKLTETEAKKYAEQFTKRKLEVATQNVK